MHFVFLKGHFVYRHFIKPYRDPVHLLTGFLYGFMKLAIYVFILFIFLISKNFGPEVNICKRLKNKKIFSLKSVKTKCLIPKLFPAGARSLYVQGVALS